MDGIKIVRTARRIKMISAREVYGDIEGGCIERPDADFDYIVKLVAWTYSMSKDELLRRYPEAKRFFYRGMAQWWVPPDDVVEQLLDGTGTLQISAGLGQGKKVGGVAGGSVQPAGDPEHLRSEFIADAAKAWMEWSRSKGSESGGKA
jgi:hypothetical protein